MSEIKDRLTIQIDEVLLDTIKNIVYFEPALTVRSFVETAIAKQVEIYEEVHKGNIPKRPKQNLTPGRPIK